jgi:hypothetical protein
MNVPAILQHQKFLKENHKELNKIIRKWSAKDFLIRLSLVLIFSALIIATVLVFNG